MGIWTIAVPLKCKENALAIWKTRRHTYTYAQTEHSSVHVRVGVCVSGCIYGCVCVYSIFLNAALWSTISFVVAVSLQEQGHFDCKCWLAGLELGLGLP